MKTMIIIIKNFSSHLGENTSPKSKTKRILLLSKLRGGQYFPLDRKKEKGIITPVPAKFVSPYHHWKYWVQAASRPTPLP